jgi:hypothetical protein
MSGFWGAPVAAGMKVGGSFAGPILLDDLDVTRSIWTAGF